MERLIAYDKLAREDRLVRMRAREVAQLKVDQGLPPFPDLLSRDSIKERVHGIMVGELQAMEGAGRTVYDFPDAPWEFTMDMARQVWDESRHVEIYVRLLEHLDGYIGEFPETTILWRCACAEDAAARVAGVNRGPRTIVPAAGLLVVLRRVIPVRFPLEVEVVVTRGCRDLSAQGTRPGRPGLAGGSGRARARGMAARGFAWHSDCCLSGECPRPTRLVGRYCDTG